MLSLKETAGQLGKSQTYVRSEVARKRITFMQVRKNGRIMFEQEWIDEYKERNTIKAEYDTPIENNRKAKRQSARKASSDRHW